MNTELSNRQQEIINVSLSLIAEGGIQSLTIKNIAKRIGFAESAIYRHYENKIQILLAILNFFKENMTSLAEANLLTEISSTERIELLFQNYFKKFSASPSLVTVIFSEEMFRNEQGLSAKVAEIMKMNSEYITGIITTGQENGEIRKDISASHLAIILMGSLRLFVKQWHMSDYSFDITEKGQELTNSIKSILKNNIL
ncbi:MAG: TetR/AcrR family transcriptional regulator [Bacteroidales bacterium]|nr:TetR/AcrR family transcriptional regulator [Bacteroidales bacterium]